MDRIINLQVNGQYLTKDNKNAGVQGEVNATNLRIQFDESWYQTSKTVTFWNARGENAVAILLGANHLENIVLGASETFIIPIPGEALTEHGYMTFVIDGCVDGVRMRSIEDKLYVAAAKSDPNASSPTVPTPSQVEQFQQQIEDILQLIYDAIQAGKTAEEILEQIKHEDTYALLAQSWAIGGTGLRVGEEYDNARYYFDMCKAITFGPITFVDDTTGYLYKMGVDDGIIYIEKVGEGFTPDNGTAYTGIAPTANIAPSVQAMPFVVTVTGSDADGYTADKTFADITAAVDANERIITQLYAGERGSFYAQLTACSDTMIKFSGWQRTGEFDLSFVITMTPDGAVTVSYPEYPEPKVEEEAVAVSIATVKTDNAVTVTAAYDDDSTSVSVITLDDNGYPVSITTDGVTTTLSWEGFDDE